MSSRPLLKWPQNSFSCDRVCHASSCLCFSEGTYMWVQLLYNTLALTFLMHKMWVHSHVRETCTYICATYCGCTAYIEPQNWPRILDRYNGLRLVMIPKENTQDFVPKKSSQRWRFCRQYLPLMQYICMTLVSPSTKGFRPSTQGILMQHCSPKIVILKS